MRKTLSDKGVRALKLRSRGYAFPDPQLVGMYIRVRPSGAKTFTAVTRDPTGRQVWITVGATDKLAIDDARKKARTAIQRVRDGLPAFETPPTKHTFEDIAAQWLARHVQAKGLRSETEVTRLLRAHVFPRWKGRDILDIRRSHVAALLDHVEDSHGARQADYVLALVRGIMNWYASRHDNYVPPIVRGMKRQSAKAQARARILNDDEIRLIWQQAEANGTFGALIRLLLLTAQRRQKVAAMRWAELAAGVWDIPAEDREKSAGGALVLPEMALTVIERQSRLAGNPFVFAGRGNGRFNSFSKAKRQFDAKLPDIAPWVLHDLRRTARSLLARAGVRPDIAERVMGHVIAGVEGVYDRHSYRDEKADALRRLAALLQTILHPHVGNVTTIQRAV
jgi:integrase